MNLFKHKSTTVFIDVEISDFGVMHKLCDTTALLDIQTSINRTLPSVSNSESYFNFHSLIFGNTSFPTQLGIIPICFATLRKFNVQNFKTFWRKYQIQLRSLCVGNINLWRHFISNCKFFIKFWSIGNEQLASDCVVIFRHGNCLTLSRMIPIIFRFTAQDGVIGGYLDVYYISITKLISLTFLRNRRFQLVIANFRRFYNDFKTLFFILNQTTSPFWVTTNQNKTLRKFNFCNGTWCRTNRFKFVKQCNWTI